MNYFICILNDNIKRKKGKGTKGKGKFLWKNTQNKCFKYWLRKCIYLIMGYLLMKSYGGFLGVFQPSLETIIHKKITPWQLLIVYSTPIHVLTSLFRFSEVIFDIFPVKLCNSFPK